MHEEIQRLQEENDKLKIENAMLKRKYELDDIGEDDDDILLKRTKTESDVFNSLIEFSDSLPADDDDITP
jgi:regulator of replication initiation timing